MGPAAGDAGGSPDGEGLQPRAGAFHLQLVFMITVRVVRCCPVNYRPYFVESSWDKDGPRHGQLK